VISCGAWLLRSTMNNELRTYALDQMHHRLRQVRSYSLLDEDGSKISVQAALVKSDPPTVSNRLIALLYLRCFSRSLSLHTEAS
jgi:hypothetical protein